LAEFLVSGRNALFFEMLQDFSASLQGESEFPAQHGGKALGRAGPELAKQLVNIGCD